MSLFRLFYLKSAGFVSILFWNSGGFSEALARLSGRWNQCLFTLKAHTRIKKGKVKSCILHFVMTPLLKLHQSFFFFLPSPFISFSSSPLSGVLAHVSSAGLRRCCKEPSALYASYLQLLRTPASKTVALLYQYFCRVWWKTWCRLQLKWAQIDNSGSITSNNVPVIHSVHWYGSTNQNNNETQ